MNILNKAATEGRTILSEYESKQVLGSYQIPVTREFLVKNEKELITAIQKVGYPLVLKGCSPEIVHKTEKGLVKADIRNAKEAKEAFTDILKRMRGATNSAVLIQEMIIGERELVAGMVRDRQFGPTVMFGIGGIFTEIFNDISFRIAPLDKRDALEMIHEINGQKILTDIHGMMPADLEKLCDILIRIGQIGLENEIVKEIDINPIIISKGMGIAVDAMIVLESQKEEWAGIIEKERHHIKKAEKSKEKEVTLDEVFAPRGIAVVGVSASKIGFAELVVHSLKEAKFPSIYPVNPKYKVVLGLPCYPSITDIPGAVDHVVVNIPAEKVLTLLDECAAKGVKSVHFFTAGFSESGDKKRADLEKEMLNKAKTAGFRIIGPNCVGIFVPKNLVVNHFNVPMKPGPVGFMSQSGGHAQNLPSFSGPRGIRFSKVVSYGNALDVDENELLEYFSQDPETEFIAAYIEGTKDGKLFSKVLKKAATHKPVVIYKGGRTEAGQRAAFGHTASMMSSVAIFDALCRQMKAIQVYNIEEMIDVLVALRFANPLPKGTGVALIGAGGGPSVLAGDEMEKEGLYLPSFSSKIQEKLKQHLPVDGSIFTNPLDAPNLATPDAIATAIGILGKEPDIHMIVYHLGFHPISGWGLGFLGTETFLHPVIDAMIDSIQTNKKPILLALHPPHDLAGMEEFLTVQKTFVEAGLPVFYSLSRLARAIKRAIAWYIACPK